MNFCEISTKRSEHTGFFVFDVEVGLEILI